MILGKEKARRNVIRKKESGIEEKIEGFKL